MRHRDREPRRGAPRRFCSRRPIQRRPPVPPGTGGLRFLQEPLSSRHGSAGRRGSSRPDRRSCGRAGRASRSPSPGPRIGPGRGTGRARGGRSRESRLPVGSSARITRRRAGQRPRHGDPLPLAAREVAGPEVLAVAQADRVQHAIGLLRGPSRPIHPLRFSPYWTFSDAVSAAEQVELLEDEADRPLPELAELLGPMRVDLPAVDDRPGRRWGSAGSPGRTGASSCPSPTAPRSPRSRPERRTSDTPWSTGTSWGPSR